MSKLPRLAPGAGLNQVKELVNLLAAAIDAGGLQNLQSVTDTGITGQGLTSTFPASPGSTNPLPGSSGTPSTPTGLQLSYGIDNYHQTHDGYIVISWTPNPVVDNIARYDIFWRKGSDANLHQLTVGGDVNLARINSVIPGLSYTFAIQAHDTAGRASAFSLEQSITLSLDVDPPAVPTGLAATAIGPSIVLTWTEVGSEGISNDLKQYQIAVSIDGGSTYPTVYTVGPGNYWIYDPTVATPFFKIATVDWTGNVSAYSAPVSATAGGTIFGPLEISGGTTWTTDSWIKGLKLDSVDAIELGGGNATKFGIGANSSNLYFFTTTVEDASGAPSYWLITTTGGLPTFQKLTSFAAGASVTGGLTTDTLHATSTSALDGDVTLGARLLFSTAVSKIIPGATSISLRNNADGADNFILTNAGLGTMRNALLMPPSAAGTVATTKYASVPVKLTETVLGATTLTVTVSSIPASGRMLRGYAYVRDNSAGTSGDFFGLQPNGDVTAGNYSTSGNFTSTTGANTGFGTAGTQAWLRIGFAPQNGIAAGIFNGCTFEIIDYTSTNYRKQYNYRSSRNDGSTGSEVGGGMWAGTSAITSVVFMLGANSFVANSLFGLAIEP